jgi:hypothetical protein
MFLCGNMPPTHNPGVPLAPYGKRASYAKSRSVALRGAKGDSAPCAGQNYAHKKSAPIGGLNSASTGALFLWAASGYEPDAVTVKLAMISLRANTTDHRSQNKE